MCTHISGKFHEKAFQVKILQCFKKDRFPSLPCYADHILSVKLSSFMCENRWDVPWSIVTHRQYCIHAHLPLGFDTGEQ